ncbi:MAG: hypothetical protein Q9220_003309 [cf. Caloplaca sp. 1 TL-2023]
MHEIHQAATTGEDEANEKSELDVRKKQSIGVIYGDIGTSPLYVYSSTFSSEPSHDDLLGALSLIIWSITLMVSIKYVLIVLRADDEGEGGTFAIYSLLSRYVRPALICDHPTAANVLRSRPISSAEILEKRELSKWNAFRRPVSRLLASIRGISLNEASS